MSSLLQSFARYLRLAIGKLEPATHRQRRGLRIVQGMLSGLAGRGVAVVVSVVSVPLAVRYLGAERYGAWVTISTAITWIGLADFGVNNSLTNAVSQSYASNHRDSAREYVAAAFWSLTGIAVGLAMIFFVVWTKVPWNRVFNVQTSQATVEVAPAVAVAFAIFVLNLPFSIVQKIYAGHQEVAVAAGWTTMGNVLGLAALAAATQLQGGLATLVIAVSGAPLLVNIASAVWVFGWSKPWLTPSFRNVTWRVLRRLTSLGGMFFLIQAAAMVLFQTDNLIITHYLGAAAVTPYSVTWRLFTYTSVFQIIANPSFWPAYAEAFSRADFDWVRRSFWANFMLSVISTVVLSTPLVFFGRRIIESWAGSAAVPPRSLLVWMGLWSLIYAAACSQACLLAASSRLRGQTIYSLAAAVVNLAASVFLVQRIGITGAILGTITAYAFCILLPQWIEVKRAIRACSEAPLGLTSGYLQGGHCAEVRRG